LGAPILSAFGVSGWIYLLNKKNGEDFTEADERLAATLATQVGVAYENARLYTDAQNHATELGLEMAVRKQAEEERARLLVREQAARSEEHTSELQSLRHLVCRLLLEKKKTKKKKNKNQNKKAQNIPKANKL